MYRAKGYPADWEKNVCKPQILIRQIIKIFSLSATLKTQQQQQTNPVDNWPRDFNEQFSKEEIQIDNKQIKKC